jgi:hypothetical protein
LQFHPESLIDNGDYQLSVLRKALPMLVDESRLFVSRLSDPKTVEIEMQEITSGFDQAVHRNVEYYR